MKINKNTIQIYLLIFLGRIHSAIVSGVNWDMRSVTVEWFEKGETKGKEVINKIIIFNFNLKIFNVYKLKFLFRETWKKFVKLLFFRIIFKDEIIITGGD